MIQLSRLLGGRAHSSGALPSDEPVCSAEQMRRVIDRERMRSDRGTSRFSLLTFTCPRRTESATVTALARIFRRRLRATDDVGLVGPLQIGAVLPETDVAGACKVADALLRLLPAEMPRLEWQVYTYPASNDRDESNKYRGHEHDMGTGGRDSDRAARGGAPPRRGLVAKSSAPARSQSMQALFVRPLPIWKRVMDVIVSAAGLILLFPLLVMIAAAIKLTSPGPVLFRQRRAGLTGRQFGLYKFRTMVDGAEEMKQQLMALNEVDGPVFKIRRDPRVTRLGALLRQTSLDELPQLWNVLRGEMSLVGPRPPECKETDAYFSWQRRRLEVTPGLTCIWQVSGRCQVAFDDWVRMDLEYIRSRSFGQDLKLLLKTVPAVISGRGAS